MKNLHLLLLSFLFFACTKENEPVQGKVEDFVTGEMSFERDEKTRFLSFRGISQQRDSELVYTYWFNKFLFFDPKTGRKINAIEIPKEGPLSIRGGFPQEAQFLDNGIFMLLGRLGDVQLRKENEILRSFQLNMDTLSINLQNSMTSFKQKITQISPAVFEISNNPFDLMSFSNRTVGFDVENFGAWTARFDDQGNWICISGFKGPMDESYAKTADAADLMRITENGVSSILFPFSDSLYQTENCQLKKVIALESISPILYFPSKEISNGAIRTWVRPDDAAMNLYLLDDPETSLKIRFTLLENKKGENDSEDPRTRMFSDAKLYLVMVYDSKWKLKAELRMSYPEGTRFENIFLMDGHLFINKPEQESEDEYEFYKIDLSRFAD